MEEPDPVRKYESEGRSGFDYGTCIRTDIVRNKLLFIEEKYENLLTILRQSHRLAVAFSGGVDSTFLLYAAKKALGENAAAFTAVSAFFPLRETEEASAFCREHGIRQALVDYTPLEREEIARNPKDRCYHCKKALFTKLLDLSREQGFHAVAEGSNLDDIGDYRPGMRAVRELGILSPLLEAQLTKGEIRELSRRFHLPSWDKPSFACLASRFVYGERITEEKLHMVDAAEELLRSLGFAQFRVRIHGRMARIEVLPEQIASLASDEIRRKIAGALHALGFSYVSVDLDGYRTGSMNDPA